MWWEQFYSRYRRNIFVGAGIVPVQWNMEIDWQSNSGSDFEDDSDWEEGKE